MRTIAFLILSLTVLSSTHGQADLNVRTDEIMQVNSLENLMRALSHIDALTPLNYEVEGSAYYCDSFQLASVILSSGVEYKNVPIRYNIYNDKMEFQNSKGVAYNINNPSAVSEILINDGPKFSYVHYISKGKSSEFFVEIIADGKARLLKKHAITLIPAQPAGTHTEAKPPKLVPRPSDYYIQIGTVDPLPFKNSKQLIDILSEYSSAINFSPLTPQLSKNREESFVEIVNYFNEKNK